MNYYEFGNRLRICRHKQDYSLQDVADMTQYSSKHIGNIERGQAKPSIDLLVVLSNCLQASPDYLLQDSLLPTSCSYMYPTEFIVQFKHFLSDQQDVLEQISEQCKKIH